MYFTVICVSMCMYVLVLTLFACVKSRMHEYFCFACMSEMGEGEEEMARFVDVYVVITQRYC
jgi:hypothetical protein